VGRLALRMPRVDSAAAIESFFAQPGTWTPVGFEMSTCCQERATKRLEDGLAHLTDARSGRMLGAETGISRETFDSTRGEAGGTGVTRERSGRNWHKLSPDNRQVVLEAVVAGFRQKDIAANYGISRGYVAMLRIRAGLQSRPRVRH
jgi:hypothetical protein